MKIPITQKTVSLLHKELTYCVIMEWPSPRARTVTNICRNVGIVGRPITAGVNEYGGLKVEHVKCFKDFERKNIRLKKLVIDLSLNLQLSSFWERVTS